MSNDNSRHTPTILSSAEIDGLMDPGAAVLFFDLLFPGGNNVAFLHHIIQRVLHSKTLTAQQVNDACAHLVQRGYMKRMHSAHMLQKCEYKSCVRYDAGGLASLRNRAIAEGWVPMFDAVDAAYQAADRYVNYSSQLNYQNVQKDYGRALAISTLLGIALTDAYAPGFDVTSDDAFDGACLLTGFLTDDVRLLTGMLESSSNGTLPPGFVFSAMSAFFFAGRDVGGMLEAMRDAAEHCDTRFPAVSVLAYGALRVWRGEARELAGIERWVEPEAVLRVQGLEHAFKCVAAGEWNDAHVVFSSILSARAFSEGNPILFPFLALAFVVGIQAGAPEAKIRKVVTLLKRSVPVSGSGGFWRMDQLRDKVCRWVNSRISPFDAVMRFGMVSKDVVTSCLRDPQPSFAAIPLCFALRSPVLSSSVGLCDTAVRVSAEHLLPQASKVLDAGYASLGGMLLAGYSRFGDVNAPEYLRCLDLVTKSRVPWFLKPYEREAEWKAVVSELARIVGEQDDKGDNSAKAKRGKIVWGLELNEDFDADGPNDNPQVLRCCGITPYYRGPRAGEDGSDDRRMTTNGVLAKAYRNLLSEQDRRILDEMLRTRYNTLRDRHVPMSIVEAVVDHPYVIETPYEGFYDPTSVRLHTVIALTRHGWHVASRQTKDGGISLSLPKCLAKAVEEPCLLRFGEHDVRFLKLTERERAFVSGFFSLAPDGEIRLPAAAIETVSPVLTAMARLAPMEGNFAALADTSGLERILGDTVPTARLAFHDDTLDIALCVKPHAKNAALVLKPGIGSPERMVKDGQATQVLVRNLADEKAAAQKVTSALEQYASWADDDGGWKIRDLVDCLGALAVLKDLGEDVRMEWREGDQLNVVTKIANKGGLKSQGGADRWFRVDGEFEIDERLTCSLLELLKAYRGRIGRFIPLGEKGYLRISAALAKRLEALDAAGRERKGKLAVAPAALPMLDRAFADDDDAMPLPKAMAVEAGRVRAAFAAKYAVPERLKATLRPYQEEGYVWLARLAECGFGACLADDMGLGKTVQLIALLLAHAKAGASLVVAPTSVGGNWRREIERFAPTLTCLCAWETEDDVWLKADANDIVITSYGMLVSREEKFLSREWNGVVLDEAQAVKNEGTERARIVKRLVAKFRVAATGTPVENRLTELWSIFDFLNPGMLGTSNEFIAKLTDEGHATPALKSLVKPLILRRLKREVLDDLPEKTEITLTVQLDAQERSGYEACRRKALDTLAEGGQENRISILAELTRLRRYCCHPSLVVPSQSESAKMEALVELLRDLKGANHRVLVFSQFTDYLAIVQQRLQAEGLSFQYLDGATPPKERERRVAAFQKGEGDVFLMSLKAGGTGLNLTAANYVVLLDPWWNPAVEDQAADRVHRIGQKQPVTVYRLIAADTVEERVLELHAEKKQLATDVLDGTGSSALTPEALMKLFG